MFTRHSAATARTLRLALWAAAFLSLLAWLLGWMLRAEPNRAPWAWIAFIAMSIVDDVLFGSSGDATWGELPKVALLAAIIVFRRHPEVTVLIAFTAAPLASLIKRQSWIAEVTATAQWVIAAVVCSALFLLIGFDDTAHVVAATVCLVVTYYVLGPVVSSLLESASRGRPFRKAFAENQRLFLLMETVGVLLALAWGTSRLHGTVEHIAALAVAVVIGLFVGFLLGGRVRYLLAHIEAMPLALFVAAGALGVLSEVALNPLSWLLPLLAVIILSAWAVPRRLFGAVCGGVGIACNEMVRAVNGGRMLLDVQALPASVRPAYSHAGQGSTAYEVAGPHSHLPWLADRFYVATVGVISPGDLLLAVGAVWAITTLMLRRPDSERSEKAASLRHAA